MLSSDNAEKKKLSWSTGALALLFCWSFTLWVDVCGRNVHHVNRGVRDERSADKLPLLSFVCTSSSVLISYDVMATKPNTKLLLLTNSHCTLSPPTNTVGLCLTSQISLRLFLAVDTNVKVNVLCPRSCHILLCTSLRSALTRTKAYVLKRVTSVSVGLCKKGLVCIFN